MMQSRTKAAAATAAVVPFHCIICFEEFNLKDRLPMVLPCGHTFVCGLCTKRLKRCMECREPLFYKVAKTSPKSPPEYHGRYSPGPLTPTQPSAPSMTQVPLPIPKNLVLISMMEAAEQTARTEERDDIMSANINANGSFRVEESESTAETSTIGGINDDDDEEGYDVDRIITGVATLAGACGTYVVKEPDGLALMAYEPSRCDNENLQKLNISASCDSIEIREPTVLQQGQTLQVVSFEKGVARLARGVGYVEANPSQLVKIGGPLDRCCRLECLLNTIEMKGNDLELELAKNSSTASALKHQIEESRHAVPNHPIITEAPPAEERLPEENSRDAGPSTPTNFNTTILGGDEPNHQHTQPELLTPPGLTSSTTLMFDGKPIQIRENSVSRYHDPAFFAFCQFGTDNVDFSERTLPGYRRSPSSESLHEMGYGCTQLLGTGVDLFSDDGRDENMMNNRIESDRRGRSLSTDGGAPQLRADALTAASFDTIDFRTGLSGHRGLQNNHAKRHLHASSFGNYHNSPTMTRGTNTRMMMMSEHRGISAVRSATGRSLEGLSPSSSPSPYL